MHHFTYIGTTFVRMCCIGFAILSQHADKAENGPISNPSALFTEAVAGNRASFEKLERVKYHYTFMYSRDGESPTLTGEGEVLRDRGPLFRSSFITRGKDLQQGKPFENEARFVDDGNATVYMPSTRASLVHKKSNNRPKNPNERGIENLVRPHETLPYSFGDGSYKLWDIPRNRTYEEWYAEEVWDKGCRFIDICRRVADSQKNVYVERQWKISPDNGYLPVEMTINFPDGSPWIKRRMINKEIADHVFFPAEFVEKHFRNPKLTGIASESLGGLSYTFRYSNISVVQDTIPNNFRIEALDLQSLPQKLMLLEDGADDSLQKVSIMQSASASGTAANRSIEIPIVSRGDDLALGGRIAIAPAALQYRWNIKKYSYGIAILCLVLTVVCLVQWKRLRGGRYEN